jgi:hypothetical protein
MALVQSQQSTGSGLRTPRAQAVVASALANPLADNRSMAIAIPAGLTDDNDFIEKLNSLLSGLVAEKTPEQLWVIQIDNWFDHKWLRFSGNGIVASNFPIDRTSSFMDRFSSVKQEFWQDKLTFPPFTPERILGQWSFLRSSNGYIETPLPNLPHRTQRRRSKSNLHKRAESFANSASFVWFSGNTLKNGRASVMVYNIALQEPVCWFAALARNPDWTLQRTKGIDKEQVAVLIAGQ